MADGEIIIDSSVNKRGAEKDLRSLKSEAAKLAHAYKKSGMNSSEAWKKAWSDIRKNSQNGSESVKRDINSLSSVARKAAAVVGGLFLLDKVKDFATEVANVGISYNAMSEQSETAWTTILGSQAKAIKMMKDIENYAAKTPFSKMGVDEMAKQLTNAGYTGQALFDQLTKFGNMGSAFGIQEASLREMVRQYSQVQQAQVAYTEDLNILQDRGIPIYKALGEVMNVPVAKIKKLASEGKITADVYNKALDSISSKTKGAMENQSQTFSGMISTFKDNMTVLAGILAKPVFDKLKNGLQNLMPKLEKFIDLVSQNGLGSAISETFPKLKPLVDLFCNIGDVLTTTVIPALLDFGGWVLDNIGPIGFLASIVGTLALAFKVLSIIKSITAFSIGLADAFNLLKGATLSEAAAQWSANLAFLACPVTWIVVAITALVVAFIYLWTTSEGFRNFWIGMWEAIKTFFIDCWNGIINFFTVTIPGWIESVKTWFAGLPAWFGQLWENVKQWFITKWNQIWNFLFTTVPNWIKSIIDWFGQLPYKIGFALGQLLGNIIKWGVDTWNYLVTNVPKWIASVVNWFAELPGRIWTWLCNTLSKIATWGGQMWEKAKTIACNFVKAIIDWFSKLPGRIWTWLCNTASKVVSWGGDLLSKGREAAGQLVSAVVDTVTSLPGKMLSIGKDIVRGVWEGITGMAGWFGDKIGDFFGGIVDGAKSALGIHSPARKMYPVGQYTVEGTEVGMNKQFPKLQDNMKSKIHGLISEMKSKVQFESASVGRSIGTKASNEVYSKNNQVTRDNFKQNLVVNFESKNYLDSEELAGHTTQKVIENISDNQDSYSVSVGGVLGLV